MDEMTVEEDSRVDLAAATPTKTTTTAATTMGQRKAAFASKEFPAQNKDNFKIFHQPRDPMGIPEPSRGSQFKSIYLTTSDNFVSRKIVNLPKQQVTLTHVKSGLSSNQVSSKTKRIKAAT